MGIWYVNVTISGQPNESQCTALVESLGSVFVNGETDNTEITIYTMASTLSSAIAACIHEVNSFCARINMFGSHVIAIEAKSKVDRFTELQRDGITEESISVKLEGKPQVQ